MVRIIILACAVCLSAAAGAQSIKTKALQNVTENSNTAYPLPKTGIAGDTLVARSKVLNTIDSAFSVNDSTFRVRQLDGTTMDVLIRGNISSGATPARGTPTFTLGAGAGTGGSVSLNSRGYDMAGTVTLTTGTTPVTGTVMTVTFSTPLSNAPAAVVLYQANPTMANQVTRLYVNNLSTTGFNIVSQTTALAASTVYAFFYHVDQ